MYLKNNQSNLAQHLPKIQSTSYNYVSPVQPSKPASNVKYFPIIERRKTNYYSPNKKLLDTSQQRHRATATTRYGGAKKIERKVELKQIENCQTNINELKLTDYPEDSKRKMIQLKIEDNEKDQLKFQFAQKIMIENKKQDKKQKSVSEKNGDKITKTNQSTKNKAEVFHEKSSFKTDESANDTGEKFSTLTGFDPISYPKQDFLILTQTVVRAKTDINMKRKKTFTRSEKNRAKSSFSPRRTVHDYYNGSKKESEKIYNLVEIYLDLEWRKARETRLRRSAQETKKNLRNEKAMESKRKAIKAKNSAKRQREQLLYLRNKHIAAREKRIATQHVKWKFVVDDMNNRAKYGLPNYVNVKF